MIMGLLFISILFGGACGIIAFLFGMGMIQSLIVYVIVGQLPFIVVPLLILIRNYLSGFVETGMRGGNMVKVNRLEDFPRNR